MRMICQPDEVHGSNVITTTNLPDGLRQAGISQPQNPNRIMHNCNNVHTPYGIVLKINVCEILRIKYAKKILRIIISFSIAIVLNYIWRSNIQEGQVINISTESFALKRQQIYNKLHNHMVVVSLFKKDIHVIKFVIY